MKPSRASAATATSYKDHFSRFLSADPDRLHFTAHSHHLWPDVTFDAQRQVWEDARRFVDGKWGPILDEVVPDVRQGIAEVLNIGDSETICFAPNTHEFVKRLVSCFDDRPVRVLSTDSEFHSFRRQTLRWEESGDVEVTRVSVEPFGTFRSRFQDEVSRPGYDLVFLSHVFFNSGFIVPDLEEIVSSVASEDTFVVIDGYHSFMALPVDLEPIADRVFFLAGGYKYAMSGEGACFLVCPPGYGDRPTDTGWFAGFDDLASESGVARVSYYESGQRFLGATFDPSGLYRMHAVLGWLRELGLSPRTIHERVRALQRQFVAELERDSIGALPLHTVTPDLLLQDRGNFLTFQTEQASELQQRLADANIVTDSRADRLRFGFGVYHDPDDVSRLVARLREVLS